MTIDRLQVVFKVVERCNINCDYCYYFNMGDQSAQDRPPVIQPHTAGKIADWLARGCADLGIPHVSLAFHGGEPMMLKPRNFDLICKIMTDRLAGQVNLTINLQTNGTILTPEWIEILSRHRVHLGFSIDGDRAAHDRHRLDHRGRSTFDATARNLRTILDHAATDSPWLGGATISVLDAANDAAAVFDYLAGLGVRRMSFLLPDRSHNTPFAGGHDSALAYGQALFDIFRAWLVRDDPDLRVRYISELLRHLQLAPDTNQDSPQFAKDSGGPDHRTQIIIVHSDGTVGVNDSYIPALEWFQHTPEHKIDTTTLRGFLSDPIFPEIEAAIADLAPPCQTCTWRTLCKGGDLENRYAAGTGFANPSVYCEGLKFFYENATALLVENGYPRRYLDMALAS